MGTLVANYPQCRNLLESSIRYTGDFWYLLGNQTTKPTEFWTFVNNMTLTMSNISNGVTFCTKSVETTHNGMMWYITQFGSGLDYFLAFLMNIGGNVVNMVNAVNGIIEAGKICDLPTVYYNSGRITRFLSKVTPLEPEDAASYRRVHQSFMRTIVPLVMNHLKSLIPNHKELNALREKI